MIKHIYGLFRVIFAVCFAVVVMLPFLSLATLWSVEKPVHSAILFGGFLAFGVGKKLANSWLSDEKMLLYIKRIALAGRNEWFKIALIYSSLLSGGYLLLPHLGPKGNNTLVAIIGIILLAVGFTCLHMKKINAK